MIETKFKVAPAFRKFLKPSRYKGAHGGRGSGKSHFFAGYLVVRALQQPGLRWVCIREVQKSLNQSVKRLIEDKISALGVGHLFRVLENEIRTPGDGLIIFQGMQNHTSDSIKSLEGYDGAWFEEAQSASQRSLDLLRPTIRKQGSELWFSWNPDKETDPVDKFLRQNPPEGAVVVEVNYWDNPWFPDVLRADMEYDQKRDPEKYNWVWAGKYQRNSESRVFKNWRIEEFEAPENARFYLGADWGFSTDPSVLVRCFIEGRTLYVDREAYKVGCEIDDTPALFAGTDDRNPPRWKNRHGYEGVPGALKWPLIADSARPETISYMQRHGFMNMKPAKKGSGSVEDGIEFLKSYDIVVHPRCKHTIDELTNYRFKVDPLTQEVLPVLEDKKNHVIDSLRYAVENLRRSTYHLGDLAG